MAKFQPRYRPTNGVALTEGQILFTGDGEMYVNADGTPKPVHSVHTVDNLASLFSLAAAYRSVKRIYKVGNNLYQWNGTSTGTITDWSHLNAGNVQIGTLVSTNGTTCEVRLLDSNGLPQGELLSNVKWLPAIAAQP